jgi:aminoglycoside/choline kinase family phosphotransferase
VPVPRVLAELPEARALVLDDAGRRCLRDVVRDKPALAEELYLALMPVVARLHGAATERAMAAGHPLEPPFDGTLYRWERDLLLTQIVRRRHGVTDLPAGIEEEYDLVARRLLRRPRAVIVHRDLQSTNIMVRGRRLTLIDFQGMRLGAAAYDLASLLCDPYVSLAPALRRRLLEAYAAHGTNHAAACRDFAWGAVQRLTQALGAYGRLTALGLMGWERHIEPAARLLAAMADECGLSAIAALARATAVRERARGARGD